MKKSANSPRIEIVCVGSELLTGKVNTHTAFLGQTLASAAFSVACEHSVGDDERLMHEVFANAYKRSQVVLCAGGLGPTFDDVTRDVWSRVLHRPLQRDARLIRDIEAKFKSRGIRMPPMNKRQADVLKGAQSISNPNGTAPGQIIEFNKKVVVLLPGPPRELVPMVENFVIPRLKKIFPGQFSLHKSFHLVGVPESSIDELVRPLVARYQRLNGCTVMHGILASKSVITVKFSVCGNNNDKVTGTGNLLSGKIRELLSSHMFGEDNDTLPSVVGRLLKRSKRTLAVAESCTGGLLSKLLTDEAGASDYFVEGIVTYSNLSKQQRLGVDKEKIVRYGAVSKQTAMAMSQGLRRKTGVDFALSITGIAGPTGGSISKPVGLVYIGCSSQRRTRVQEFRFNGDREWIRHRSALMALDILRKELVA